MKKKVIVIKELPNLLIGTILELSIDGSTYYCIDKYGSYFIYSADVININEEWFRDYAEYENIRKFIVNNIETLKEIAIQFNDIKKKNS